MKRIFLDTNFILDFLSRQEYKSICQNILIKGKENDLVFYISFLTVANFAYISRKLDSETLYDYIDIILSLFNVVGNNKHHIERNIELKPKDFEDGLQYFTAIEHHCDCIITRNKKDFYFSDIPVFTPTEFSEILDKEYGREEFD